MKIENTGDSRIAAAGAAAAQLLDGTVGKTLTDPNERHFKTDHLRTNLKQRTISSGAITVGSQGMKFFLTLASTAILARLLVPGDFGLLAMVMTITNILFVFKDAGLSSATIQQEGITHAQVSNLFWINVTIGGALGLVLACSSPVIAWFYHEPRLVRITIALSMSFLLSGSTVQHQALLKRQMRFKALALIEVGSMATGLIVGTIMAWSGCGYWSLVGSSLSIEGAGFLITWTVSKWRPRWPSRRTETRPLLKFGANMMGGAALYYFSRGTDTMLLGRYYGPDAVGLYSRAMALLMRPLEQFLTPISAVFMPTLSRLQNEPERYRRVFLRVFEGMALVSFAASAQLLPLSRPITLFLLGPKWEAAAVIFSGFTIAALTMPIAAAAAWLLITQGRSKEFLVMNIFSSAVIVLSFVAGLRYGPVGVACAFSASCLLFRMPIGFYIIGRKGPVATKDLWFSFFRHLPLWIVVLVATYFIHSLVLDFKPVVQLLICGPAALAVACATVFILPYQRSIALDAFNALKEMRAKRVK